MFGVCVRVYFRGYPEIFDCDIRAFRKPPSCGPLGSNYKGETEAALAKEAGVTGHWHM